MAIMTSQTRSVVTNLADFTPAMREALESLYSSKEGSVILHRTVGNSLVGRNLAARVGDRHYAITDAGIRVHTLAEREAAPTVVVQSLGSYGWSMLAENDFGGHAITTWTRDEHTLVLSWTGAYEVSAAIYDGLPLPLDRLVETVLTEDEYDESAEHLMDRAASRAAIVASPRFAAELSHLFVVLATVNRKGVDLPLPLRTSVKMLAAAILATPHAR